MRIFKIANSELNSASEQVQLTAVKQNVDAIQFIENPSEKVQLTAVKQNVDAIQFIENPSEEVQLAAIKQNVDAIYYIENPNEQIQLAAVNQTWHAIENIENPSLSVLNKCKHEIIKAILIGMKDGEITSSNHPLIQKISETNWPELDIIKKSLNAINK
jgi:hypothetical protein